MNIIEIFSRFPKRADCINHIESVKWANSPICPYCGSAHCTTMKKEKRFNINRYHCNKCNATFSVLVGTIFQDTKLELQKWFLAIFLIFNSKKGISSRQLARDLQVNVKTAWSMQIRIRKAMFNNDLELLKGIVETDEIYNDKKNSEVTCVHRSSHDKDKSTVDRKSVNCSTLHYSDLNIIKTSINS